MPIMPSTRDCSRKQVGFKYKKIVKFFRRLQKEKIGYANGGIQTSFIENNRLGLDSEVEKSFLSLHFQSSLNGFLCYDYRISLKVLSHNLSIDFRELAVCLDRQRRKNFMVEDIRTIETVQNEYGFDVIVNCEGMI